MTPDIQRLSTPMEILEYALHKERMAHQAYGDLLQHSKVEVVRDLIGQLKDEELRHVHLVEKKIAALNLGRKM